MGWTTLSTWVAGEVVTEAGLNNQLRDNMRYLKGVGQVPTISSGLVIDNTDGDEYFKLPNHTTVEATSVLSASTNIAKLVYDGTVSRLKYRDSATIQSILTIEDVDDIPVNGASTAPISSNWAYDFINIATSAGDILYATSAGAYTRLGIGSQGQFLTTSSTNSPAWTANPTINYKVLNFSRSLAGATGDQTCSGFGFTPKAIQVTWGADQSLGVGYSDNSIDYTNWYRIPLTGVVGTASYVIYATQNASNDAGQYASVKSFDADGFTLTWNLLTATIARTCSFGVLAMG